MRSHSRRSVLLKLVFPAGRLISPDLPVPMHHPSSRLIEYWWEESCVTGTTSAKVVGMTVTGELQDKWFSQRTVKQKMHGISMKEVSRLCPAQNNELEDYRRLAEKSLGICDPLGRTRCNGI